MLEKKKLSFYLKSTFKNMKGFKRKLLLIITLPPFLMWIFETGMINSGVGTMTRLGDAEYNKAMYTSYNEKIQTNVENIIDSMEENNKKVQSNLITKQEFDTYINQVVSALNTDTIKCWIDTSGTSEKENLYKQSKAYINSLYPKWHGCNKCA